MGWLAENRDKIIKEHKIDKSKVADVVRKVRPENHSSSRGTRKGYFWTDKQYVRDVCSL